ncbi:MAG: ABC transporter permease [Simkania sp.]|uniref:Glycine betaine/carnitine/choline transport system permease protein opuCB n=1 Tax=Simkania negevensis (strain ATCC VR-1471 / DSM 27360 / Z) TaxID=331113 RepID=F8L584_SIMNZ|nr:ABC transporter permease [Simkania negevensis]MCB1067757.1 ABC transporter permease [Simkania sp.]MCB1075721.1 ABC transporter permease [Simkania sp.]MCB1082710.1 ABC transporter permease [Simkania sp.]CCB87965.1 glycine betaine/carnitine/choline transport system permease protein opuCB [Simkania negevensis Z]
MTLLLVKIWEHLELTFISLFFAMLIAIPLGIYLTRLKSERIANGIMRFTAMIQTVPGLALIALIVVTLALVRAFLPLPTTGFLPSVVVLVLYALMPILINTYTGIKQVSSSLKMVARSMGMTYPQIFFHVELPLSLPVLLTGVRIAFVTTIGMVTLTSLVGSGGLGDLIVQGLRTIQVDLVLAGTIPAALLAIIFDIGLLKLGRYLAAHS